jgi:hypothetical protein
MLAEMFIGAGALATGGFVYAKSARMRLYRQLARRIGEIHTSQGDRVPAARPLPDFADRLAVLPELLRPADFARLAEEARRLSAPERSYVPTHKQGGTLAYETLIATAPAIVAFYHSESLQALVGRLIGTKVEPTTISAGTLITISTAAGISPCCSRLRTAVPPPGG